MKCDIAGLREAAAAPMHDHLLCSMMACAAEFMKHYRERANSLGVSLRGMSQFSVKAMDDVLGNQE